MPNERKLTKAELKKREDIVMDMKKNKRELTKRYGGDAEAVMYGRATKLAKQKTESMNPDKIREMIKDALQNPEKADLNKDGKLSSYEKKRSAAIEKSMMKEDWGGSDQYAMNQSIHRDLGNPTKFPGLSQIMSAAEDAVDFYWDDWEEYQTDRDGLIMSAAQRYARKYFPEFMAKAAKMVEPIDESNSSDSDFDGTGLIVIGRTQIDNNEISDMLDDTDYYGEWNVREGYWFFPEDEEILDSLEIELEQEFIKRGINARFEGQFNESVKEDLDLGHQDNEPGMLKGDLYRIGKYAMELYQMMDDLEGKGEVDFPHWWQSKIVKAKDMVVGAKHYLDFELKEPQIDAMVDIASEEDVIDEAVGGKPSQEEVDKFFEETFQETHYLASKPVEEWDEYDMSNWKTKLKKKEQGRPQFSEHLTTRIMKTLKESKYKKNR